MDPSGDVPELEPAEISAVGGDSQSGAPGDTLADPLVVKVTDASGDPVPGVLVSWAVTDAGGTVEPLADTTDHEGHVSAVWILGEEEGTPVASAVVEGAGDAAFAAVIQKEASSAPPAPVAPVAPVAPPAPPGPWYGVTPAFPGAEGFGATALSTCDRSRPHVFIVDDRGDSGRGTFREAMARAESAPDNELKVIVFRVGGYIRLISGGVNFSGNCLYVAGQTAPGDGVTLRGHRLEFDGNARDIVLRYFRIRVGHQTGDREAIIVRKGERYVFDHLSLSWSDGSLLRFTRTQIGRSGVMSDISVQHSLLAESLSKHPTAISIGGEPKPDAPNPAWKDHLRYSIHNNALVGNNHRNGEVRGLDAELINNVVHNWSLDAGSAGYGAEVDWVNNYFKKGPMSRDGYVPIGISTSFITEEPYLRPSLYIAGNVSLGGPRFSDQNTSPNNDNWQGSTRIVGWYHRGTGDIPFSEFRRDERIPVSAPIPVSIRDPYDAYRTVLEMVGASKGLHCEGGWFPRRDAVDQRLVEEIRLGTGRNRSPSSEGDVGGFPSLHRGTACDDSNGDGIPDAWMLANGLDPDGPSVTGRMGSAGYSYLEHYLNGTMP